MRKKHFAVIVIALTTLSLNVWAHPSDAPSVHDTMATIIERLKKNIPVEELKTLTTEQAETFLTEEEREILGTAYWMFEVDVPVTVSIIRHTGQAEIPHWLIEQEWEKTNYIVKNDGEDYEVWQKNFDAGHIGLGTNGFRRHWRHYYVAVQPQEDGDDLKITNMYPGQHRVKEMTEGVSTFVYDSEYLLEDVPAELEGAALIQSVESRVYETLLVDVFRTTPYPASPSPDQIVLTWSDDPATTQTVQWRTDTSVTATAVRYREAGGSTANGIVPAVTEPLEDKGLVNDTICHRHTATLTDLQPGTQYEYGVTDGDGWTEWIPFETAPGRAVPFKFIYMGDAQNGLDTWGILLDKAWEQEPDVKFYVMAGDLVNRGIQRDDWDSFWHNASGHYDRKQLVPAIGNHEDQGEDGPWMYLDMFDLPDNGSPAITNERSYSFNYGNAQFIILDTNADIAAQTPWLEGQLANSAATWKFVVYHHPAYSSAPRRDNQSVRKYWTPLFDKYHVDVALQGHDHGYLRTFPIYDEKKVETHEDGTVYVVSVSGTKFYDQEDPWYEEFGMTKVATYQVLDITIDGATMTYKAYDIEGELRDEFVIKKK